MRQVAAVLGLVLVVNCGGGSSGFHPSVAGSKPIGQLSEADSKMLCKDTVNYINGQLSSPTFVETECRIAGVLFAEFSVTANSTDAQLQAACQAGYGLCKASPPDAGTSLSGPDGGAAVDQCNTAVTTDPTCTATVDQYSACVNETISGLENAYPPCNQLTMAKLNSLGGPDAGAGPMSGAACGAFQAACPGVSVGPTMGALRAARR